MKKLLFLLLFVPFFVHAQNSVDTLQSGTVTNAPTMDIVFSSTAYRMIEIKFYDILPATSGQVLNLLITADGTTWDNTSGNYSWFWGNEAGFSENSSGTGITNLARISGGGGLPNGTGQRTSGTLTIFNPGGTTSYPKIRGDMVVPGSPVADVDFAVSRLNTQVEKGIRLQMGSGNISGSFLVIVYK